MTTCPAIVKDPRFQSAVGAGLSVVILALALQPWWGLELGLTEAVAVVSYAWSVWLLARNKPLGWWVGLLGVVLYGVVFFEVRLFAEVGIQAFYFVTNGTREGEHIRHEMHGWFLEVLRAKGRAFVSVGGSPESRLAEAAEKIEEVLVFPALELA